MQTLEANAQRQFVAGLSDYLCAHHLGLLPRFPLPQRHAIVGLMLERAAAWGATWQASLALYADLMQRVAPNFDRHPEVAAALRTGFPGADERILSLPDRVSRPVWVAAEAQRVDLYLFTSPTLDAQPLAARTAAALPLVLWDRVTSETAIAVAEQGAALATRVGIGEYEDGPLVGAALITLYGAALHHADTATWRRDVMAPGIGPEERLMMLRLRIALDHGRRV
jgi:hypothetical protein